MLHTHHPNPSNHPWNENYDRVSVYASYLRIKCHKLLGDMYRYKTEQINSNVNEDPSLLHQRKQAHPYYQKAQSYPPKPSPISPHPHPSTRWLVYYTHAYESADLQMTQYILDPKLTKPTKPNTPAICKPKIEELNAINLNYSVFKYSQARKKQEARDLALMTLATSRVMLTKMGANMKEYEMDNGIGKMIEGNINLWSE